MNHDQVAEELVEYYRVPDDLLGAWRNFTCPEYLSEDIDPDGFKATSANAQKIFRLLRDQVAEQLMSTQEGRTAIARAMQKRNPQLPHFAAMRVLTPEKVEEIRVAIFERGMSYSEAAAAFGISKSSVARALRGTDETKLTSAKDPRILR